MPSSDMPSLNQIVLWPDGEFMWVEEFEHEGGWEGCMSHKSDDYEYVDIPLDVEEEGEEALDMFIKTYLSGGWNDLTDGANPAICPRS